MKRIFISLIVTVMVLTASTAQGWASEIDVSVIHRQKIMDTVGALMGALGCVVKKECILDNKAVTHSAEGIAFMAELSGPAFRDKTEGATVRHTAKPEIWHEWTKFQAGLKNMGETATKIAVLAASDNRNDAIEAVGELGKTCKNCHDSFRTK